MNYSKYTSQKKTPQSQPIFGSKQTANNAGGYGYKIDDQALLERFLAIGSEGGTYYVSQQKLTIDNAKRIVEMIQKNTVDVVNTIITMKDRVPKLDPSLFVLALVCTYGNPDQKKAAYNAIPVVAKTSTHLFNFCANIQDMRGWSRGLRNAVASFYTTKTTDQVAYQMVKYRQRNGWTHKDVLRLSHAVPTSQDMSLLFSYAVGKCVDVGNGIPLVKAFENANTSNNPGAVINLIKEFNLTWEMIPTTMLNNPEVQEALLEKMPLTALLRNLNRFTASGLLEGRTSLNTATVVEKLTNWHNIVKSGIHPINVLNTMKVYAQGRGEKGKLTWTPNQSIVDALQTTFEQSFKNALPTGKNILVGVDISGSMGYPNISNMALSPREASAALMLTLLKSEPNVEVMYFDTQAYSVPYGARSSYDEVVKNMPHGGGTNCSLPYEYALHTQKKYDAIITLTDSETWHGQNHPVQAFEHYRLAYNKNCKGIIVGMVANEVSLFSNDDPNALNIAGFDSAIPQLINDFIS